jgi:hypothetical protein
MLLPREQSPWNCGYFLGAIALQAIEQAGICDLPEIQRRMSLLIGRSISPTQVVSAAAWLYLLGAIRLDDEGMVTACN